MKILVYGAGVLGSLYAARLSAAGNDVTVLDRLHRLADIREHGIVLEEAISGRRSVEVVGVAEELEPEELYDLVLVPVLDAGPSLSPTICQRRNAKCSG